MKRILLGTTALVAAGALGTGTAHAKFDVTVNGEIYAAYGVVSQDDGDGEAGHSRQNQAVNQDDEIHFRATETLDNGIQVGARVQLEAATHNGNGARLSGSAGHDQIDERHIFFKGGFGEIRVGDEDDARKLKSYTAPDPTGYIFSVNSPYFTFRDVGPGQVVSSNSTTANLENDSAKIIYFTPSFGGFQFAFSYAPDGTQDRTAFGTGGTQEQQVSNAISIGGDYSGEFGGVSVSGGAGYTRANNETNTTGLGQTPDAAAVRGSSTPYIWDAGINIGFAGFTVGGSITFGDNLTSTGFNGYSVDKARVYDVGVTYNIDAVTVGLDWSHGDYNDFTDGKEDELDDVALGVRYALGPGVDLAAFVGWFNYNDGGALNNDNTGWQAGVGTGINF